MKNALTDARRPLPPKYIIAVVQTPPPFHGQAIMNQYMIDGSYSRIKFFPVKMAFSKDITEVGRMGFGKVAHLVGLIGRIILARITNGPTALYYPPASPNLVPFLRDCAILITTRWMFSKAVFHFHANGISEFRSRLPRVLQWLYRVAYDGPDLSICLSSLATGDAEDFRSKSICIVPNGIPDQAERFLDRKQKSEQRILYLGTVSLEKGVGILLESLALLKADCIPFQCTITGPFANSETEIALREQCRSLGLDAMVRWQGSVTGEEKWQCYQDADIFCFPTYYETEGFPVVLLEAMMFSLPCVSTEWRAIPDIIVENQTGFLVPPKDPSKTAARLQTLIQDSNLRLEMGRAGRKRYEERFTIDAFRSQMEEALSSVV